MTSTMRRLGGSRTREVPLIPASPCPPWCTEHVIDDGGPLPGEPDVDYIDHEASILDDYESLGTVSLVRYGRPGGCVHGHQQAAWVSASKDSEYDSEQPRRFAAALLQAADLLDQEASA